MTIQILNTVPWWNNESLSKPSKTLFISQFANNSNWQNVTAEVISFDFENATLQINNTTPNTQSYWRITIDGTNYYYYFTDTVVYDNLTTNPVQTITLKVDKWGCICALISNDFDTWQTQVLATNINLNIYEYWDKVADNQSSYMWIKNIYPQFQSIQLIKYQNQHLTYSDTNYYYKLSYQVTAYNNTDNPQKIEHISGNLKDYNVTYSTSNATQVNSLLPWDYVNSATITPFLAFSKVVPWNEAFTSLGDGISVGKTWTVPLLLSFSTDKDIGLIQLPFDLANFDLPTINEFYITGNQFIDPSQSGAGYIYTINGTDYYFPSYDSNGQPALAGVIDYLINADGIDVWNITNNNTTVYFGGGNDGGCGWGWNDCVALDSWIFGNVWSWGFWLVLDKMPNLPNISNYSYNLGISMLMCPMLFNFYNWNASYMGQTITYDNTYANSYQALTQCYYSSWTGTTPNTKYQHKLIFSANYPNLSLNWYASDNIKQSTTTPIGQINLSTAFLPNTTNPQATFETNEKKIINNSATLKNLDLSSLGLSYLGGLGLNSIMNPLSFLTGAAQMGLDVDKINLNYSNSFGTAKRYELGHSNTLQTAGDNLGSPDNKLVSYIMVPAINDIINIMAEVDKYGYIFNQWLNFNGLFGCYYHNYIKLTQNADLLVYQNANTLFKNWQEYLILQFTNGIIIWSNLMPDNTINFFDAKKWGRAIITPTPDYQNPGSYDANYYMNFKLNHQTDNLTTLTPLIKKQITKTVEANTQEIKPKVEFKNKLWKKL